MTSKAMLCAHCRVYAMHALLNPGVWQCCWCWGIVPTAANTQPCPAVFVPPQQRVKAAVSSFHMVIQMAVRP